MKKLTLLSIFVLLFSSIKAQNSIPIPEMVFIPGGTFKMGNNERILPKLVLQKN